MYSLIIQMYNVLNSKLRSLKQSRWSANIIECYQGNTLEVGHYKSICYTHLDALFY